MTCAYLIGHHMPCKDPATQTQHCDHHASRRCVSCHAPATHNCTHTKTSICGHALCDGCEHVELPGGISGQFYNHARQGEDPVIPHYGLKGK